MSPIHALIIEDHRDSIDVLGHLLRQEGATFVAVSRPVDLRPTDLEAVNVVFLDLEMPGLDGYQMLDKLRNEYGVRVPIVAYTGNTNERSTARSLGFNGMLGKPLDDVAFHQQFARILNGESVWDE